MLNYKNAFKPQSLSEGENLAYAVPKNTTAQVRACTFHNKTEGNVSIEVFVTQSAAEVPEQNQRLVKKTLGSNESYLCPEIINHVLEDGYKVYFVGVGVNAMLSVLEQTV